MKITIIGAGNLGLSIALGISKYKNDDIDQITITRKRQFAPSETLISDDIIKSNDNVEAIKNSDVVILAVQPNQLKSVAQQIKEHVSDNKQLIISTITGKPIKILEDHFSEKVPIIRCIPNIAVSVGESMTCISCNKTGKDYVAKAEMIFSLLGKTLQLDDEMMQAATVICGSGIAFWMRLIRATTQGAIQLGFSSEEALLLSVQTCLGSAKLLNQSNSHPEIAIDKVTTPKGCTISGLNEMEHNGLSSALIKGLLLSFNKINEIRLD